MSGPKDPPPYPSTREGSSYNLLVPTSAEHYTPSPCGRARSSEEAPSVLLCLGRGALPSATRGLAGVGPPPYILYNKVSPPSPVRLLSILHSFFAFFLKNLLQPFASLRKSLTFALAKREHLLRVIMEDVFLR